MKRAATVLLFFLAAGVVLVSCGGPSSTQTTSGVAHRLFITNTQAGILNIVNADNDQEIAVSIPPSGTLGGLGQRPTYMVLSGDRKFTFVYTSGDNGIAAVDNINEQHISSFSFSDWTDSFVVSPDVKTLWAAVRNSVQSGQPTPGAIEIKDLQNAVAKPSVPVPLVHYLALNHAGTKLLGFSDLQDSVAIVDTATNAITMVAATNSDPNGVTLDRPVAAFFSADDSKAYVLSCGAECGGTATPGASVTVLDLSGATPTLGKSAVVPAATVGLMDGNILYVAGSKPGVGGAAAAGTLSVIDVSTMTVSSGNGVTIGDGYHSLMSLTDNGKIYVAARNCTNDAAVPNSGCLSIYDVAAKTAVVPAPSCAIVGGQLPTCGDVTGLQPIPGRKLVYLVQGGELIVYDATTSAVAPITIDVVGKATDVKLVDDIPSTR